MFNERLNVGVSAERNPYIPSFAAQSGLLGEPKTATNPGLYVGNGFLLGSSNGGVIRVANKQWGIDLVAVKTNGRTVDMSPTEKDCVFVPNPHEGIGTIRGEGVVVLSDADTGLLVIAGIVTACRWQAEDARVRGSQVTQVNGHWVIQSGMVSRAEVSDVHAGGEVTARLLP